ncbi:hypothetical protein H0H87_012241 [Tephrocybe sp. NHM501043]|nr:hypothetical protein H0H87_012241 [Tephrocybe sp. NHM501043]
MPQLLNFARLPFRRIGEFIEAVEQFLEVKPYILDERAEVTILESRALTLCTSTELRTESEPLETVTGLCGQDQTVRELLAEEPYNPFKLDVYQLSNVVLNMIKTYHSLEALTPLAQVMTSVLPQDRPLPSQALDIHRSLDQASFEDRVWPKIIPPEERYEIEFPGKK